MSEVPGLILGADVQFSFFFLVEKKLITVKKFLSVAKMAPTVYKTETCSADSLVIYHNACMHESWNENKPTEACLFTQQDRITIYCKVTTRKSIHIEEFLGSKQNKKMSFFSRYEIYVILFNSL